MSNGLHMIRLVFGDLLALQRFARAQRLPEHPFDADYVVHCALGQLFAEQAPHPFLQRARGRVVEVLGYSQQDKQSLQEHAQAYAMPEVWSLVDWNRIDSKPMPKRWPIEKRLGFYTRACPLVRGPRGHGREVETKKARPEVDAYLAHLWQKDTARPREEVYRGWLARELSRGGAAGLVQATLRGFQLKRLLRHDGDRKSRTITRPDVRFQGLLEVNDSDAFTALLTRGLGRHRAFGFGMLLLYPRRHA
ncbi:MAG: type I-E CRISPR-associated protein Cas6/Cse3/CasE [Dehalococcoidia bacterium]|nr:type I-E CRISPR-associated protein Cas6/Cse3/CasE [Dehalococcoidia bacterium]